MVTGVWVATIGSTLLAVTAVNFAWAAHDADPLAVFVTSISAQIDPRPAEVIPRIAGTGRQLLALRSYLRVGEHLPERWTWSPEQIAAFEGSPEQRDLQLEIDRVRAAFAAANPGFELYVNPQVRNLDTQIKQWNSNESVTAAAEEILTAAQALIASPGFPADRPERAREALKALLIGHTPTPTPTIAAPGLSPHGQMRGIDFQVHQGGRVVAGPNASSIAADWDAAGWAAKLDVAVRAASRKFVGPLASPREPWHYTYTPEAVTPD
jgi:hypothetical protein